MLVQCVCGLFVVVVWCVMRVVCRLMYCLLCDVVYLLCFVGYGPIIVVMCLCFVCFVYCSVLVVCCMLFLVSVFVVDCLMFVARCRLHGYVLFVYCRALSVV